jgi:hypothetical protein
VVEVEDHERCGDDLPDPPRVDGRGQAEGGDEPVGEGRGVAWLPVAANAAARTAAPNAPPSWYMVA